MQKESIDFVITWVDGSDEDWLREKQKYQSNIEIDNTIARYRDFGTLKYVLRSIEKFAPWVRNIFLVTNGQVPKWISFHNPKLKLVKHSEFIPQEYLPTFNSNVIEWNLYKIQGLSENFVYFNDDVILTDYVKPSDFFKDDLPCDSFGLGVVAPTELFSKTAFNNMCILNKHFNLKETLKRNRRNFFSLKYGGRLVKTYILSRLSSFYGMYDPHITLNFKKSYFEILWNQERECIEETCKNRFRAPNDITIWLIRYWQLLKGDFFPRSTNFGCFFTIHNFIQSKKTQAKVIKRKYKVICVNDSNQSSIDFEIEKKIFETVMNNILAGKCSFEK